MGVYGLGFGWLAGEWCFCFSLVEVRIRAIRASYWLRGFEITYAACIMPL